jgi:hypothetical protein
MEANETMNTGVAWQGNYPPVYPVKNENAPHAISGLVFGIVSLATMAYFGWIMAIIALNNAKKALSVIEQNPGKYSDVSLRMANAGRTMGIIGLIFGILGILIWILYFVFIFTLITWATPHHYY